ncbi:MAG TPA: ABC transporter ATP-binding protein [Rhodobacterales bacterium]|nr:ABC transporter ATP-binding protein [Rhodobacterales bacterium]
MQDKHGIELEGVSKTFGTARAIDDVTLHFPEGAFSVLLGPSGCGKSTLLRLIAGLETPSAGHIRIGGASVEHMPAAKRGLGMVFQSYALFPHLSVAENIVFGLKVRRVPKGELPGRLDETARLLGLETLLDRRPSQLSGGQQQRVALARAIISGRKTILMDEPLSNLDAKLRAEMRVEIRALQRELGLTMIYVTHDQVEAITMADRVVLLNAGRIEQVGSPDEIYERPASALAARFIGTPPMNVLRQQTLAGAGLDVPPGTLVGVRPEEVHIAHDGGVAAQLENVEYLGADRLVSARIGDETLILRVSAREPLPADGVLKLDWLPEAQHLFDASSGRRIETANLA